MHAKVCRAIADDNLFDRCVASVGGEHFKLIVNKCMPPRPDWILLANVNRG